MTTLFRIPVPPGTAPSTVLAVHPTQLYEIVAMLAVFMLLWRWRRLDRPLGWLFGVYLIFAGVERFLVEFLRAKDDRFLGGFTVAQLTSLLVVAAGSILTLWLGRAAPADPGAYLLTGKKA
jgi:phosphatidylglycerol:prolipoprotein diacylglycerol transferase